MLPLFLTEDGNAQIEYETKILNRFFKAQNFS
jgi:hypothetical protein